MLIQKQCNKLYFTGNSAQTGGVTMFFIIAEAKETPLDFS